MNSLRNSVDLVDARGSNIFITQELKGAANQHVTYSQKRKLVFCCDLSTAFSLWSWPLRQPLIAICPISDAAFSQLILGTGSL